MLTRADGVLTFHDVNAHLDVEQANRDLSRPELIDARGAVTELTADQIHRLVQRATQMLRTTDLGPTAIVTTNDLIFGLALMYVLLSERAGVNAEVFRDMLSARNWLDEFEE
jgi:hypothetical protein